MKNKIFEVLNEKIFVWTIACDSQFLRRPDQNGGAKETAGLKKQNRLLRFLFLGKAFIFGVWAAVGGLETI